MMFEITPSSVRQWSVTQTMMAAAVKIRPQIDFNRSVSFSSFADSYDFQAKDQPDFYESGDLPEVDQSANGLAVSITINSTLWL